MDDRSIDEECTGHSSKVELSTLGEKGEIK